MARIKIGVQLQPQHTSYADFRKAWLDLDAMGVDTLWNWDHFFPLSGNPNGDHFEGWTTLAMLGAETRQARVGCLVLCMSYRNPAHLSQMAKTLDHATNGRLILGLGAGWFQKDYTEYGYNFGTAGSRLRALESGIQTIKDRWSRDVPKPVHGSIPILIGGSGEKVTLRITAQHADMWHAFGSADAWSRKNKILDEWCAKVGRDPRAIERSASISSADPGQLDQMVKAGATHLIYALQTPWNTRAVEQILAWRDQQPG
ncbi:MAG: LLM class F420-dependent oxidoreductase [Chloroflexota bacterium]